MTKVVHTSGKRKTAVARATIMPGTGRVRFNRISIEFVQPKLLKLKLMEPLLIADKFASTVDISINVKGGGPCSQIEAARLAIAKGLVEYTKSETLKNELLNYERQLLVADIRRKECKKPNCHSKARAKTQKSYR